MNPNNEGKQRKTASVASNNEPPLKDTWNQINEPKTHRRGQWQMAPWGPKSEGEVCVDKGVLGHRSRSDHSGGPPTSTQSL